MAKVIERLNKCSASGKQTRLVRPPAAGPAFTSLWVGGRLGRVWGREGVHLKQGSCDQPSRAQESFFVSKGPRPVAAASKFDPFAKKGSSSTAKGGKRPAAVGGGSKAKKKQ